MSRVVWILIGVALAGCSTLHPATQCPSHQRGDFGDEVQGMPCDGDGMCFVVDDFSSCASGYYQCVGGAFQFDHGLDPLDGASCADSPLSSCSTEGNDCSAEPTGGGCACGTDGNWQCFCRCYGQDCPSCPATQQDGVECTPIGNSCPYAGGHHCDCVDTGIGAGIGVFHCS